MPKKPAEKPANPLVELLSYGQSVWYDNINRELIRSGELKRMVDEDGLRGVTSNPTIFEKAITGSDVYTQQVQRLHCAGTGTEQIYEALAVEDIQSAADELLRVYEESNAVDGYVSLEVAPTLAHDTAGTVADARRLHAAVGRRNVMIKVPATPAGLPAIEQLIDAGININVTLIFSVEHYLGVVEAYLRGLEARERRGEPLRSVASVASVFVSRVDTAIDKILAPNREAWEYLGRAGIANAKVIYGKFKELFSGSRFSRLKAKGAQVQRPLWASTGVKNPRYSDVLYVEALIGADTVDTMPPATMTAFKDHGIPASRLEKDLEAAPWLLGELARFGVDVHETTAMLQHDGVESFAKSWEQLMQGIEGKAKGTSGAAEESVIRYRPWLNDVYQLTEQSRFIPRIWDRDPTLWHHERSHHALIRNSLGWLTLADTMLEQVDGITAFVEQIRAAGFTHILLLGMGGSSRCAQVCRDIFGVAPGHPELRVVDTTDPTMIGRLARGLDLGSTLFIVSSKTGATPETVYLQKYFWQRVHRRQGERAGEHFVAITDPGTSLERLADEQGFRRVFLNFKDMVGRYAGLSYFGMVPAALIGVDVRALLTSAARMAQRCGPSVPVHENPGAQLGTIIGELALNGRDKLTLVLSAQIASFGSWVEQLMSESTGKAGRGVVVVTGEQIAGPQAYGRDRVFVALGLPDHDPETTAKLAALEAAGHPVVRIGLTDRAELGAEMFRWQFATAIAGAVLAVDPFDQPDVQESKDNTKRLIEDFRETRTLPRATPKSSTALGPFLRQAREFDYVALLAYVDRSAENEAALHELRKKIHERYRVATTVGFGPALLHSTGQLHKGGPRSGLFVQITAEDAKDLSIPGERFTFGVLKQLQALGDLEALRRGDRPALHLHLRGSVTDGLKKLTRAIR